MNKKDFFEARLASKEQMFKLRMEDLQISLATTKHKDFIERVVDGTKKGHEAEVSRLKLIIEDAEGSIAEGLEPREIHGLVTGENVFHAVCVQNCCGDESQIAVEKKRHETEMVRYEAMREKTPGQKQAPNAKPAVAPKNKR